MRFLLGFLIGFALGSAAAILFAPPRAQSRERPWQAPSEEEGTTVAHENHDFAASLRRTLHSLQAYVEEAWAEAAQAAAKAEKEMRARYQEVAGRGARGRR